MRIVVKKCSKKSTTRRQMTGAIAVMQAARSGQETPDDAEKILHRRVPTRRSGGHSGHHAPTAHDIPGMHVADLNPTPWQQHARHRPLVDHRRLIMANLRSEAKDCISSNQRGVSNVYSQKGSTDFPDTSGFSHALQTNAELNASTFDTQSIVPGLPVSIAIVASCLTVHTVPGCSLELLGRMQHGGPHPASSWSPSLQLGTGGGGTGAGDVAPLSLPISTFLFPRLVEGTKPLALQDLDPIEILGPRSSEPLTQQPKPIPQNNLRR